MTRWQKGLEHDGWNALFIENHDKARVVSTWGNDDQFWRESATALAAMYFLMRGTPFIYQGQEIGMTNTVFESMDDFRDVAAFNLYRSKIEEGHRHEEVLNMLANTSRDNSRTPMQWSNDLNGGFSVGQTWMKVNPNYQQINVADQLKDKNSILHFYKNMIAMKKQNEIFTYGSYDLLMPDHEQIFAYKRELNDYIAIVITNLSKDRVEWVAEDETQLVASEHLLLANHDVSSHELVKEIELKPYEARVYLKKK